MSKNLLLLLGNGFTIDLIYHLRKTLEEASEIDVSNFFKYGAEVPWPVTNQPGFLSFQHCPNLWNLGARPNMDSQEANVLIEDIITCINVYASHPRKSDLLNNDHDIYFSAYLELIAYLRSLFVFYNKKIDDIPDEALAWTWSEYLTKLVNEDRYEKINIVTYNYDIWLERLLTKLEIPFSINGFNNDAESKIQIFKPHGSISFKHESIQRDHSSYKISDKKEIKDAPISEFHIDYENLEAYDLINALIPPAGDSNRIQQVDYSWSGTIHKNIIDTVEQMERDDDCIICGLSYWHVDRNELDSILVHCKASINMKMINPSPTRAFTAVLTSLFSNLIVYPNANILKGLNNE